MWHQICFFSIFTENLSYGSYDFLLTEKKLTLYNVTIHIKSVFNKDKNHHYY